MQETITTQIALDEISDEGYSDIKDNLNSTYGNKEDKKGK